MTKQMHDPGDEHRDAVKRKPSTALDDLLAELQIDILDERVFERIEAAEAARSCCQACALAANGEDGS